VPFSISIAGDYTGEIEFEPQARDGKRYGTVYLEEVKNIDILAFEYILFTASSDDDYWVERLNNLGLDGWEAVPSIYWGIAGKVKILLKRRINK